MSEAVANAIRSKGDQLADAMSGYVRRAENADLEAQVAIAGEAVRFFAVDAFQCFCIAAELTEQLALAQLRIEELTGANKTTQDQ